VVEWYSRKEEKRMSNLSEVQQARAVAVDAASRVVAENLGLFTTSAGGAEGHRLAAASAVESIAVHLSDFILSGPRAGGA
jgi:hypothetical protein